MSKQNKYSHNTGKPGRKNNKMRVKNPTPGSRESGSVVVVEKKKNAPPIKKKYIDTPEKMWELFKAYAEKTKSNPILVHDFVGKDAEEVQRKKERPLTMEGFEVYVYDQGLNDGLQHYFANTGGNYSSYLTVCARIRNSIRNDQIEGGMAGIYNPSITQRLNNLVEKQDLTTGGDKLPTAQPIVVKPEDIAEAIKNLKDQF